VHSFNRGIEAVLCETYRLNRQPLKSLYFNPVTSHCLHGLSCHCTASKLEIAFGEKCSSQRLGYSRWLRHGRCVTSFNHECGLQREGEKHQTGRFQASGNNVTMPKRSSKQKDTQQLARSVLDAIVPDAEPAKDEPAKNPAAVALGRLGGLKGGKARAAKLSPAKRKAIAKKAAAKRWGHESSA